jgi:hypothetical protein
LEVANAVCLLDLEVFGVGFGHVLCCGALNFVVYIHVERHLPASLCLRIGLVPMQRSCDVRAAPVLRMFFASGQAERELVGIRYGADAVVEALRAPGEIVRCGVAAAQRREGLQAAGYVVRLSELVERGDRSR